MSTPKQRAALEARMNFANVLPDAERADEFLKHRAATGFVVDDGEDGIKILTCAHLIDHVFTARKPISAEDANKLFQFRVVCDHAEVHFSQRRGRARAYSTATVIDIDCSKDMLLLNIASDKVYSSVSAGGKATTCTSTHPSIHSALIPPQPEAFDIGVMVSWPSEKHLTSVRGQISHCSRTIKVMPGENENGYNMKLYEVDIRSQRGASGSPLLNGQAEFTGLLHGGDVQFSYFVSLDDILEFLERNGITRV
jgi:hypothetical protein